MVCLVCFSVLDHTLHPFDPAVNFTYDPLGFDLSQLDLSTRFEPTAAIVSVAAISLALLALQQFIGAGIAAFAGPNSAFVSANHDLRYVPSLPSAAPARCQELHHSLSLHHEHEHHCFRYAFYG